MIRLAPISISLPFASSVPPSWGDWSSTISKIPAEPVPCIHLLLAESHLIYLLSTGFGMLTSCKSFTVAGTVGAPDKEAYWPSNKVGLFLIKSNDAELLWFQSDCNCAAGIVGWFNRSV